LNHVSQHNAVVSSNLAIVKVPSTANSVSRMFWQSRSNKRNPNVSKEHSPVLPGVCLKIAETDSAGVILF
jgi:hypothetical protein